MIDKTNTPDEILDLVDENDQVIGKVAKKEANSNPASLHREILVLIHDDQDRVLLQQRSFKKKVYPGAWAETCAGHVPQGWTYEQTAHQELLEELGFDTDLKFIEKFMVKFPNETHFAVAFVGKYRGEKIKIEAEEVEQARFVNEEEFDALIRREGMLDYSVRLIKNFWRGAPLLSKDLSFTKIFEP